MFFRRPDWRDYEDGILRFAGELGRQPWTPSRRAREFLLSVQRGYHRVGLAGACDAWRAMACANLWLACVHPDRLQLVTAGSEKSGRSWVRYLKLVAAESHDTIREHLLFSEDDGMLLVRDSDEPVLAILGPGHVINATKLQNSRPTVLVMPDLERVPTTWFPQLRSFIPSAQDQWLTVAPVRR